MEQFGIVIEEIKEYSPQLLERVRQLTEQLDNHFQELKEDDLRGMITAEGTHLFVARLADSQEVIGMTTLIVYRIPYKMKGWIEDVVVDKDYRKHGIGTKLLEISIEKAREKGVKSLNLTSNPARRAANAFYQSMGFEKRDTNVYRLMLE